MQVNASVDESDIGQIQPGQLVANPLRHTPAGGRITLHARRAGDDVLLAVADTGEGMAPEHLPHVFDKFYKVDPSRPGGAAGSGLGLGLSIVKAVVERHGGTVRVASDYPILHRATPG